ncbi:hypothetical protein EJB05_45467, partial [Eragrostis curvula]
QQASLLFSLSRAHSPACRPSRAQPALAPSLTRQAPCPDAAARPLQLHSSHYSRASRNSPFSPLAPPSPPARFPPLNPLRHCIETARRSARRGGAVGGGGAGTLGRHQAKPVVHAAEDEDGGDDGVGWSRSLTDDDIEELKGCADLGFKFSYDEIPEFCYSMSQRLLDDHPSPAAAPEAVAPVALPITPTGRSPAPEDGAIAAAAGSGAFVLDAQQVFEEQEDMSKIYEANGKEDSISMAYAHSCIAKTDAIERRVVFCKLILQSIVMLPVLRIMTDENHFQIRNNAQSASSFDNHVLRW